MKKKKEMSFNTLYRLFIYVALLTLAVSIVVPVAWVFLASVKETPSSMGIPGPCPRAFIFRILSTLSRRPRWESTF